MFLSVNNRLVALNIRDEDNNIVCQIRSIKFFRPEKGIYNSKNNLVYTTDILITKTSSQSISREYVAYCSNDKSQIAASATLEFQKEGNPIFYKLPAATALKIRSIYGDIMIKRLAYGKFTIIRKEQTIGSMSVSPLKKSKISCDTIQDHEFLAVLFTLTLYMMHENDLYTV